jgi:predicted glycogen debranching enzyme
MNDHPADDPVRHVHAEPRMEWLVCNGLGGYASGTIHGVPTRRYHGYLIAALPNPAGRVMMLNALAVQVRTRDRRIDLGWVPPNMAAGVSLDLVEFRLEVGLPVWRYRGFGLTIEKRVVASHAHNTVMIEFRLLEGGPVRLEMRPSIQFRGHDEPVSTQVPEAYPLTAFGSRIELAAPSPLPALKLHLAGSRTSFVIEPMPVPDLGYATEESRGYASRGQLYSPGRFRADLQPGGSTRS